MGRKALPEGKGRTEPIQLRVTPAEREEIFLEAGEEDKNISEFLRDLAKLKRRARLEGKALLIQEPGRLESVHELLEQTLRVAKQHSEQREDNFRRWETALAEITTLRDENARLKNEIWELSKGAWENQKVLDELRRKKSVAKAAAGLRRKGKLKSFRTARLRRKN